MNNITNNSQDQELKQLIEGLASENGLLRKKSREQLVARGERIIDSLKELAHHPKHMYRWEAIKTMAEIRTPMAMPLLLEALEDDESDIRWIAAQGLIRLGALVIKPLLHTIIEKSDSILVLSGAHHVFHDLKTNKKIPADFPVDNLLATIDSHTSKEGIKLLAYELLNTLG
jgi:HEAT repeat protein